MRANSPSDHLARCECPDRRPRPVRNRRGSSSVVRVSALVGILSITIVVLTGCPSSVEVRVPAAFATSGNIADVRHSITAGERTVATHRIRIVPHETAVTSSFQICGRDGGACQELVFGELALESTIEEAKNLAARRDGVERIVVFTDDSRRWLCDEYRTRFAAEGSAARDGLRVSCRSPQPNEPISEFVDDIESDVILTTDVAVVILGEATAEAIRRLGATDGPTPSESGGGIIPELFLSPGGERLREAGYPVLASIAPDFSAVSAAFTENGDNSAQVHVPYALFRY